jgi:hypothetical protein
MTFKEMKFKVENPSHSEAIQRELFKLGYKWNSGDVEVLYTTLPTLMTWDDGTITYFRNINSDSYPNHTLTTLEQLQEYAKMTTPRTVPLEWPADEPFPYKHLEGRSVVYTTALEDCTGAITIGFETPATPHDLVAKAFNLVSGYNLSSDDVALILQLAKRGQ